MMVQPVAQTSPFYEHPVPLLHHSDLYTDAFDVAVNLQCYLLSTGLSVIMETVLSHFSIDTMTVHSNTAG